MLDCVAIGSLVLQLATAEERWVVCFPVYIVRVQRIGKRCVVERVNVRTHTILTSLWDESGLLAG